MKAFILALALLGAAAPVVTFTGCKAPQQVVAYKSLAATQATVASAREAFLVAYNAGLVKQDVAEKAMKASHDFNTAFSAAVLVARTTNAPTPETVAAAAAQFLAIVAAYTH